MEHQQEITSIGIIGGGPSALFLLKRIAESGCSGLAVTIFEKKSQPGAGMPYSAEGANEEHVTNVSGNEIPLLATTIKDWIKKAPAELLSAHGLSAEKFNDYKVVPRLFFGEYLSAQFELLVKQARKAGNTVKLQLDTTITDIVHDPSTDTVTVVTDDGQRQAFGYVVISTGHCWPKKHEDTVPRYFDSPYPPAKLKVKANYPIAIRGASLTAVDAVRTLSREHGSFTRQEDGKLQYSLHPEYPHFKLVLHSLGGLLPAIRFHLEDPRLHHEIVIPAEELSAIKAANDGFVPLDYLFRRNFLEPLRDQDPGFYEKVKDLGIEAFVDTVMRLRERLDPFVLLKAEYAEAEKSIRRRQSVYWKEMLASLSFAMNAPAKYLCAEDMMRLKKTLMPLISIVIAFVPQSSCDELLALYDAGVLSMVAVDRDSTIDPQPQGGIVYNHTDEDGNHQSVFYDMFIDCIGQPHFMYHEFPFKSLLRNGSICAARLRFKSAEAGREAMESEKSKIETDSSGNYYLHVPGIAINDHFQVLDQYGAYNERLYIMAVPHIGGFNPDYSGLDFCEASSQKIMQRIMEQVPTCPPTPA